MITILNDFVFAVKAESLDNFIAFSQCSLQINGVSASQFNMSKENLHLASPAKTITDQDLHCNLAVTDMNLQVLHTVPESPIKISIKIHKKITGISHGTEREPSEE